MVRQSGNELRHARALLAADKAIMVLVNLVEQGLGNGKQAPLTTPGS